VCCSSLFLSTTAAGRGYDPRAAFLQAAAEWHPRFASTSATPLTVDDVVRLCDMYYTPFEVSKTRAHRHAAAVL
jgi:hypothetical protein